jgi:hypothetical protein
MATANAVGSGTIGHVSAVEIRARLLEFAEERIAAEHGFRLMVGAVVTEPVARAGASC